MATSATTALTSRLDLATGLSSKSAFTASCNVAQAAPTTKAATHICAIRASSNDNEKMRPARREVLAGILAAGAALGLSGQVSAAIVPENPVGGIEAAVDGAASNIKRRMDGLFGKDKPYGAANTQVTGKGAIADAKARVGSFLDKSQNPLATNIEKAGQEASSALDAGTGPNSASARAGKEFLGKDSTRVDEATARVNAGAEKLQNKAVQALDDAKRAAGTVVGSAKDAAPDVNVQAPGTDMFKSLGSKLEGAKGDVASKAEGAKSAASSVLPGQ